MIEAFEEILVTSSLDGSREPSLLWLPEDRKPEVLVVGLHTWSATRPNQVDAMFPYARERGWALLLPEFRGANLTSNPRAREAGGSSLARRDIVDATRHVINTYFDRQPATFLVGGSGGGHMSLMVAGAEDFQWTAVSAWCPITDLALWHRQNANYAPHIEAVCGGPPGEATAQEYAERSPINYASQLAKVRLQLAHGRHDRSVPYIHSWQMACAIDSLAPKEFYFYLFPGAHELRLPDAFGFFDDTLKTEAQNQLTG